MKTLTLTPLLVALALAGCATAPKPPELTLTVPAAYKEAAGADAGHWKPAQPAEGQARGDWWLAFQDAKLNALEQQAQAASPNLAAAAARVKAARAALGASQALRLPQVGLDAGVSRQKNSAAALGLTAGTQASPATVWQGGVTASYEIDLFQRVANGVNAATADAQASQASYRSVLLALQADVAQTYYQLRSLDAEVALLARSTQLREQTLKLIQQRRDIGDVSELDVSRAQTELATTRAEWQGVKGTRARTEHALALLLGQVPSGFDLAPQPLTDATVVPNVPAGLPSTLLERRPDVAAAQAQMMAATARVGEARSALFPALNLTASGGSASYELKDLFAWSTRSWLTSAVLSLPLFDGGRNKANIARIEALLEESAANYQQSLLAAFGDVEDKLSTLGAVREQASSLNDAVVAARRSADLADKRYRAGEDSFLTLLDAQRSLLAVERQALQSRGVWATATVGLIRALGGGWQAPEALAQAGLDVPRQP
jgi:multidrug efflux system outer membrane protein